MYKIKVRQCTGQIIVWMTKTRRNLSEEFFQGKWSFAKLEENFLENYLSNLCARLKFVNTCINQVSL